jgi:hypothetical protein
MSIFYDFIEIGTCDFDTLIQNPENADKRGLSIDPVKTFLDRLPDRPNVTKLAVAVSDHDGEEYLYTVSEENIVKHGFPSYCRGCSRIGSLHGAFYEHMTNHNIAYDDVVERTMVPIKSFPTLVKEHDVGGIGTLKIDAEGHDGIILNSYLEACRVNPRLYAKEIFFESNGLYHPQEAINIVTRLQKIGYRLVYQNFNTHLVLEN